MVGSHNIVLLWYVIRYRFGSVGCSHSSIFFVGFVVVVVALFVCLFICLFICLNYLYSLMSVGIRVWWVTELLRIRIGGMGKDPCCDSHKWVVLCHLVAAKNLPTMRSLVNSPSFRFCSRFRFCSYRQSLYFRKYKIVEEGRELKVNMPHTVIVIWDVIVGVVMETSILLSCLSRLQTKCFPLLFRLFLLCGLVCSSIGLSSIFCLRMAPLWLHWVRSGMPNTSAAHTVVRRWECAPELGRGEGTGERELSNNEWLAVRGFCVIRACWLRREEGGGTVHGHVPVQSIVVR